MLQALGLLVLSGLDTRQSLIHESLVVLLEGRYVQGMLGLELCQLPLTFDLGRLQTSIPFFFDCLHIIFDLLSLLFLDPLTLFNLLNQIIPLPLSIFGPFEYLLYLDPELPLDPINDLILPPLHLLPIVIEPFEHLIALPLEPPLFLPHLLHLILHTRIDRRELPQLPPQPPYLLHPLVAQLPKQLPFLQQPPVLLPQRVRDPLHRRHLRRHVPLQTTQLKQLKVKGVRIVT